MTRTVMPWLDDGDVRLYHGSAAEVLRALPAESAQTCVTSPPYFGLRDYGHDGQLGLEPSPDEYVAALVAVFREVRRVLRDDGTLWLNLGDTYAGSRCGPAGDNATGRHVVQTDTFVKSKRDAKRWGGGDIAVPGLKLKDMIGIPWRVAFALQDDGWYLRSDIIWAKPNPMPESVTDRPTKAHEYLFLLSKGPRYFYDADAIREDAVSDHPSGNGYARDERESYRNADGSARGQAEGWSDVGGRRNRRSVWTVNTQPYPGAHFATFPPKLIEPCVLAGASEGGTVLDPFSGSGTTAFVARNHQRRAVGIDISEDYLRLTADRLSQLSLLGDAVE